MVWYCHFKVKQLAQVGRWELPSATVVSVAARVDSQQTIATKILVVAADVLANGIDDWV
jgi:hypothetical protein